MVRTWALGTGAVPISVDGSGFFLDQTSLYKILWGTEGDHNGLKI